MKEELITIEISDDTEVVRTICESVKSFYQEEELDPNIESCIGTYTDQFKDGCYFLIEYPYVDKLYRDSYYQFFSSKHRESPRDCIRVSIFDGVITNQDFRDPARLNYLKGHFRGFFIVRPILSKVIGRSWINVDALVEKDFYTCDTIQESSINGVKLAVVGFPHATQNKENMTCAETSLWVILEYFSHRYPYYKSTLPSEIIGDLSEVSDDRLLPSFGLDAGQMSFYMKQFGFGTKSYTKTSFQNLFSIMLTYIESGIPFIAVLSNPDKDLSHAVVVCGKEKIKCLESVKSHDKQEQLRHTHQIKRKVLIMDDGSNPYKLAPLDQPYGDSEDPKFTLFEFDSIIVPLYPKIYLEADQAEQLSSAILRDEVLGYDFGENKICRLLLSSSRSFKMHVYNSEGLDPVIKDLVIRTKMPKFIWCLEVYDNKEKLTAEEASGLLLIDATEVNGDNIDSLIMACYPDKVLVEKSKRFIHLELNLGGYSLYKNNLR